MKQLPKYVRFLADVLYTNLEAPHQNQSAQKTRSNNDVSIVFLLQLNGRNTRQVRQKSGTGSQLFFFYVYVYSRLTIESKNYAVAGS